MTEAVDLVDAYAAVLRDHLADKPALSQAGELGREMFEDGHEGADVVRAHERALERLAGGGAVDPRGDARAAELLAETLSSYESAARGERLRLLGQIVGAQDTERRRIAEHLHDDSIQAMTAVSLWLDALLRRLDGSVEQATVERLVQSVSQAIRRLRRLMLELSPPELERDGLRPALRLLLEETLADTDLAHSLEDKLAAEPPLELRQHLYRVAQEALTNVRDHAQAAHVSVEVETRSGGVAIRVRDDGVGFDPVGLSPSRPDHSGLAAMEARIEALAGTLEITSRKGEGTTVSAWVPLPSPEG